MPPDKKIFSSTFIESVHADFHFYLQRPRISIIDKRLAFSAISTTNATNQKDGQ